MRQTLELFEASTNLVVAQPHSVVCHAEGEHVVMEGLALGVALGGGEHVRQHLLQQLQMGLLIECLHQHLSHFKLSASTIRGMHRRTYSGNLRQVTFGADCCCGLKRDSECGRKENSRAQGCGHTAWKLSSGRDPFRWLPLNFSSAIVCTAQGIASQAPVSITLQ